MQYFKLKNPKSDKETSIQLHVYHSNFPYRRFVYGIKESIEPELWDSEQQRPTINKELIKQYKKVVPTIDNDLKNLTRKLDDVALAANNYFHKAEIDKIEQDAVFQYSEPVSFTMG